MDWRTGPRTFRKAFDIMVHAAWTNWCSGGTRPLKISLACPVFLSLPSLIDAEVSLDISFTVLRP